MLAVVLIFHFLWQSANSLTMIIKKSFDVIVIGAGPAGSTAVYLQASEGFRVLILDESAFPRGKR